MPNKEISVSNLSTTSTHVSQNPSEQLKNPWHSNSKLIFMLIGWLLSTSFMASHNEKKLHHQLISIDDFDVKGICRNRSSEIGILGCHSSLFLI